MLILLVPEPTINVAALEQLVMPTAVVHSAALENQYRVGVYQYGETVRDDNDSAAFGNPQQIGIDYCLAFGVERARRLIEDQDPRITDQRAGDRQSLALTAGQVGGALLDSGFIATRQMFDKFLRASQARGIDDLLKGRIRLCCSDRFADCAAEQEIIL